jgi:hypothetical protein
MSSTVQRKTRAILTLLLVSMAIATAIECQSSMVPAAHEPIAPLAHRHGSSPHAAGGACCLVAVLPAGTLLIVFLSMRVSVASPLLHPTAFISLPFVPPRAAARQYRMP